MKNNIIRNNVVTKCKHFYCLSKMYTVKYKQTTQIFLISKDFVVI